MGPKHEQREREGGVSGRIHGKCCMSYTHNSHSCNYSINVSKYVAFFVKVYSLDIFVFISAMMI